MFQSAAGPTCPAPAMAEAYPDDAAPVLVDHGSSAPEAGTGTDAGIAWTPMVRQNCAFPPAIFQTVMLNFIRNPNINTSWLFRADITRDQTASPFSLVSPAAAAAPDAAPPALAHLPRFPGFQLARLMVRTLVPRNVLRDAPLDQTCLWYTRADADGTAWSLVVYIPHGESGKLPFYHPNVRGVAHLHQWSPGAGSADPTAGSGAVSVHFLFFDAADRAADPKTARTALHLLTALHKHGKGQAAGYKKRVHHDVVVPQARFQNRYAALKSQYAGSLVRSWAENTDPSKHVFEDLGIAAFLIELWADMYSMEPRADADADAANARLALQGESPSKPPFPGFVDIGCGNGLLVYILRQEGYRGWGFDARDRRSWATYSAPPPAAGDEAPLQAKVLLPVLATPGNAMTNATDQRTAAAAAHQLHNGVFPPGTFIISNHADELTPWTPLLAAHSRCPFLMIPCCSHNLAGDKFRAHPPRDRSKPHSAYASLVDWVEQIAEACGYRVETEMLRIPSTRNTALLGRTLMAGRGAEEVDLDQVIARFGGCAGYRENVMQLVKGGLRGH